MSLAGCTGSWVGTGRFSPTAAAIRVFSLGAMRKISEEGARFQSHLDGSSHMLTPEKAVEIQEALGSDIAMVLDECIPPDATRDYVRNSTERTIRWAERCLGARRKPDQLMFGIIQGGLFDDLRQSCVDAMSALPFEGFAVGGLGVGEGEDQLYRVGSLTVARLPAERPRYLMGVGRPQDIHPCGACRLRHVRLRDSDAQCAQRHLVHVAGQDQYQARRVCPRCAPA